MSTARKFKPGDKILLVPTKTFLDEHLRELQERDGYLTVECYRTDCQHAELYVKGNAASWLERRFIPYSSVGFGFPEQEPAEVEAQAKAREDHARRKGQPLARGVLYYAPDALAYVAEVSVTGNDQHNPGQPLHWAKDKSTDHGDCILRHQVDFDELDKDGKLHAGKVAWRALMQLQTLLESRDPELAALRQAQRDRQAKGER